MVLTSRATLRTSGQFDAGTRVEIDAKLVGVSHILLQRVDCADGVGMKFDATEIDDPGKAGGVVDDDLFGGAAGGKGESDGAEEGGQVRGSALLVEGLGLAAGEAGSVDEALEDDGTV